MTKPTNRLTAVKIKAAPVGQLQDGGWMILDKTASGGKWVWRYSFAGTRREMGLGSFPAVSLADARRARDGWLAVLNGGLSASGLAGCKIHNLGETEQKQRRGERGKGE